MSGSPVEGSIAEERRRTTTFKLAESDDEDVDAAPSVKLQGHKRSTRSFQDPTLTKMKVPAIEFLNRPSYPLVARIYEPSTSKAVLAKAFRFLITGLIEPKNTTDEEHFIYEVRSFGMYLFHIILVFWVIYGTFDLEYNYHSMIISDLITDTYFESTFIPKRIKFKNIRTPEEIWDFIEGVILKIIYPVDTMNDSHSILTDSVFIGVAQIRQVRVKKDVNCKTAPLFKYLFKHCYGYFSEEAEDKEPFGLNSSAAWKYTMNVNKHAKGHFHEFTGDGYVYNFSLNYNLTVEDLNDLENSGWIRVGTRAVFVDFSMYSPNTNTFLQVKIIFELMPWGAVIPKLNVYTIKLLTSLNDREAFLLLGVHLVLLVYTIGLHVTLILRFERNGWTEFFTFYNLIDLVIIFSTYATIFIHLTMAKVADEKLEYLASIVNYPEHASFWFLRSAYESYHSAASILGLCIVLKFYRYAVCFNETARMMFCAIKQVKGELLCFTITNISVLFGWGFIYSTIYGRVNPEKMTPMNSLVLLIYHHARAYEIFEEVKIRERFISFPMTVLRAFTVPLSILYINCISLQMYLALMIHGWHLAGKNNLRDPLHVAAIDLIWMKFVWLFEKLKLFRWANDLERHFTMKMNEKDYYLFTEILRRYGWKRLEIRLFLNELGIRKGDSLSMEELSEAYQEFWVRNTLFFEVNAHNELNNDLVDAVRMVKFCDSTIEDLKVKIERLTDQYLTGKAKTLTPPRRTSKRRSTILTRIFRLSQ